MRAATSNATVLPHRCAFDVTPSTRGVHPARCVVCDRPHLLTVNSHGAEAFPPFPVEIPESRQFIAESALAYVLDMVDPSPRHHLRLVK